MGDPLGALGSQGEAVPYEEDYEGGQDEVHGVGCLVGWHEGSVVLMVVGMEGGGPLTIPPPPQYSPW